VVRNLIIGLSSEHHSLSFTIVLMMSVLFGHEPRLIVG
jgi:hypothetical protein